MTRLFLLFAIIAGALASKGSRSLDMASSSGGNGSTGGGMSTASQGGDGGGNSGQDREEISINVGPVRIQIIGTFNGLGKWRWEGKKPGENATIHQVTVGDVKDGKPVLAYDPPSVDAMPGDYVQFNFKAQNHTVTQSTFEKPCLKMPGGLDSGFMPNPNNTMPVPPSMMFAINDTEPLWFYCRQATHCGKGMAFGINPGGAAKMAQFLENAKAQNGTAANSTSPSNGFSASNSTSSGNSTSVDQNGLPASAAIASPTSSPLSNLVPGTGQSGSGSGSGGSSGSGGTDECSCNCLCDLGSPGMGGLVASIPL